MAGIRYGRSFHSKHSHKSQIAGTKTQFEVFGNYFSCAYLNVFAAYNPVYGQYISQCYHGKAKEFVDSTDKSSEQHMMLDFMLGKDVGIGTFNEKGTSVVSAGVRLAQFRSSSELQLGADPVYHLVANTPQKYHDVYEFASNETRSFHGLGPEVSWDASQELLGNDANGANSLDWGVNLGVLFGKRNASLHHTVNHCRVGWKEQCGGEAEGIGYDLPSIVEPADDVNRSSMVSVPNIGGYIGASMKYRNGKVSLGYRADTFFNAIDGGEETAKSYNRGFYGPYLNVSLGL